MNFKKKIKSQLSNHELRDLIIRYFENHNFKLHTNEQSRLVFKKGSLINNMITFNPLGWKNSISIKINNSEVDYEWIVDSTFQATTIQEERVWDAFVSDFNDTVENGKLCSNETIIAKETNRKSIGFYILYTILGGIAFGIPSGIIANYTGIDSIASIGTTIGAMLFLFWRIKKEKAN